MNTDHSLILLKQEDHILTITINRPEKKNALTSAMYEALTAAFQQAKSDDAIHVLLISGTKDIFTAGNDLQDFMVGPKNYHDTQVSKLISELISFPKPLIAAVNGYAVGIGTTLLLHCDLVYLGEAAKLQLPFVQLGACPEAASSALLPRLVGHLKASEYFLLGQMINAQEALSVGLANEIFPAADYFEQAYEKAKIVSQQPPGSVQLTKKLLKEPYIEQWQKLAEQEGQLFMDRLKTPEAQAIIAGFFKKK